MKTRRRSSVILCLCLCVLLSACTPKKAGQAGEDLQLPGQAASDVSGAPEKYHAVFSLPEHCSIVSSAVPDSGSAYLLGCNFQKERAEDWIVRYNRDQTMQAYPLTLSEQGYVVAFDALDGDIYYLERIDQEDGTGTWILHSPDSSETLDWPVGTSRLNTMAIAADQEIVYIADEDKLQTCSLPDGALLHTVKAESDITKLFRIEGGDVIAYCEDSGKLYCVADDGKGLIEKGKNPLGASDGRILSGINSGYDCLILDETALSGWNIGASEVTQIFLFDPYGLAANNISALACMGEHTYLGATWRSGDPQDRLFWMTPSDVAQTDTEEKVLTIAGLSRPMALSAAIADFKALCPEYRVEYIDYAEKYADQAQQRLQIDMVQGAAPDLLFVNALPFEVYAGQGLLEDLYPWIEADPAVDAAQFTQNLLRALESGDKHLYQIPQSYSIVTTACLPENNKEPEGWTFAQINRTMETHPELRSAFFGETNASLTRGLLFYSVHTLIDYENAESHFDESEALAFLTFLNRMPSQITYDAENQFDALKNRETLFAQLMLQSAGDFSYVDEAFQKALAYPGYPDAPGGSFYLNLPMAIPTQAREKTAAWEFMKMLFSAESFSTRGGWLPLQQSFETSLEEAKQQGASEESLDRLAQIQAGIHHLAFYDAAVTDIVCSETAAMFAGARTLEETAEQIERRVQLYLSEQYG